jgi:hypothetical protein
MLILQRVLISLSLASALVALFASLKALGVL